VPSPAATLLAETLRPDRRRVVATVVVLLVGMLLPLAGPALIGRIVDDALAGDSVSDLTVLAAAYLGIAVAAELVQLVLTWASVQLAWRAGNRLRERLAAHALDLDLAWHGRHSPGQLISRIDGDVEALTTFFGNVLVQVLGNAVVVTGVVVISSVIDWRVGLVVAGSTLAALAVMVRLRSVAVAANDAEREVASQLYGDLEERLGGLEDLRANGGGDHALHRLHVNSARTWRTMRRAWFRSDGAYALSASVFAFGSVATLGVGTLLHRSGTLSLGAVLALFRYSQMVRLPLERVAEQLPELQKALAGAARASRLLADRPTITSTGTTPLPAGALAVDLSEVALAYGEDHPALHGVDLHLAPGTTLGVVGRSGSGKTTLGRLLLRFWDPTGGSVRLGGVDLRDVAVAELRHRVAVVTQEVELFRTSVRENLTLFGSVRASDDDVAAAIEAVGLGEWVAGLPEGIDTVLEGATGLSAGQAQLLAFARAFLLDPGLVVLDEASSRLDPATEALVAAATSRLLEGRTAVVIAHRLSTLDRVDELAVVDGGRIVEHGPRAALAVDPDSRYASLLRTAGAAGLLAEEPV
jgi:ABC-type multidrug transport system fused ATPase/permease subunit